MTGKDRRMAMSVFKTHTDYNLEQMEELQRVMGRTLARKETLRKRTFFLAWGAVLMGIGLFLAVWKGSVLLALVLCALGAVLLARGIFFYQLAGWASSRALGDRVMGTDNFLEKSEILVVRGKDSTRYPYSSCQQLLETERSIYFMMEGGQGLILDKESLHGGTVEELREFLAEKCGKPLTWVGRKGAGEKSAKP